MCYDTRCRKGAVGMTIKKRLFCSNILMIAVPAAIVALVGLLCMALLWLTLQSGSIMRLEDGDDLTHMGRDMVGQLHRLAAELDYAAVLGHHGVVGVYAHAVGYLRVLAEHAVLAVDGDEEARPGQREHHLLLLL